MPLFLAPILAVFAAIPSWVWKWIGIALLIFCAYVYVDRKATHRAEAKCEAAAQEAVRRANTQDTSAAEEALQKEKSTTEELRQQKASDNAELATLRNALAGRTPAARCVLTQPDADGLRY